MTWSAPEVQVSSEVEPECKFSALIELYLLDTDGQRKDGGNAGELTMADSTKMQFKDSEMRLFAV
jgi:hypothetical protein